MAFAGQKIVIPAQKLDPNMMSCEYHEREYEAHVPGIEETNDAYGSWLGNKNTVTQTTWDTSNHQFVNGHNRHFPRWGLTKKIH